MRGEIVQRITRVAKLRNMDLTSSSSAAPSEGAGGYLLQYFNHVKGRKQAG